MYSDGQSKTYEVARMPESDKFSDIALTERYRSTEFYRYFIKNSVAGEPKMYFVPNIRENDAGANLLRLWYIRNANRLVDDTDVCDIPEFVMFVIAFAKQKCMAKEGHPGYGEQKDQTERQRRLMIDSLSNAIIDGNTRVEPDMSIYEEQS